MGHGCQDGDALMSAANRYWETRYKSGGDSGLGSQGRLLDFKLEFLNGFMEANDIDEVIDFGSGDGSVAMDLQCRYYTGFDPSMTAVKKCRDLMPDQTSKRFFLLGCYAMERADLALSLDVIFHLVDDHEFHEHMAKLFFAGRRFVIIYSSNNDDNQGMAPHVKHRTFTDWVEKNRPDWILSQHIANRFSWYNGDPDGSFSDFFVFKLSSEKQDWRRNR